VLKNASSEIVQAVHRPRGQMKNVRHCANRLALDEHRASATAAADRVRSTRDGCLKAHHTATNRAIGVQLKIIRTRAVTSPAPVRQTRLNSRTELVVRGGGLVELERTMTNERL
jgi:hypothetical protein